MEKTVPEEKKKKKRGCLIIFLIFLGLLIAALIAASIFVSNMLGKIEREEEEVETLSQEEIDQILNETEPEDLEIIIEETTGTDEMVEETEEVIIPTDPVETIQNSENVFNVLLIGQDTYSNKRSRSDVMILCTVNKETKTLTLTSFMRDLYVDIPGYKDQRLNVPYVLGGFKKLYQTLEHNFGVEVEHGIAVNFSSFPKVIDAIGGVDIELTKAEAKHLNKQNDTWSLEKGVNHLDGFQALAYARIRKLDSDFARTQRQRKVLRAVVAQAKTLSPVELYDLVNTLIPLVKTDMTDAEIIGTALDMIPLLMDLEVKTQRIPINGEYKSRTVRGMAVLVPDRKANRQFLEDTIGDPND